MLKRFLASFVLICFSASFITPYAKASEIPILPVPGTMVSLSSAFEPTLIKGLTINKDNPFLFDFIVDTGGSGLTGEELKKEGDRLVKYFFAALTIPEGDLWVNLSPYEKDRMVPEGLGQTALGRDLLAQDYLLKQLTASLIYPEKDLGKKFWNRIYTKAQQMYGTTEIPVNTFNKVWIVADKASVFEHGQTAFVVGGHLRVMLETDYLAMSKHDVGAPLVGAQNRLRAGTSPAPTDQMGPQIIRELILPEIEHEINTGKNFAILRQIFYSQVLATWFKRNLKQTLINQVYSNKGTVKGIDQNDTKTNEAIYQKYLQAYKKGAFNYIKEEEQSTGQSIPRKYFSGGYSSKDLAIVSVPTMPANVLGSHNYRATVALGINDKALTSKSPDAAMTRKAEAKSFMLSSLRGDISENKLHVARTIFNHPGDFSDDEREEAAEVLVAVLRRTKRDLVLNACDIVLTHKDQPELKPLVEGAISKIKDNFDSGFQELRSAIILRHADTGVFNDLIKGAEAAIIDAVDLNSGILSTYQASGWMLEFKQREAFRGKLGAAKRILKYQVSKGSIVWFEFLKDIILGQWDQLEISTPASKEAWIKQQELALRTNRNGQLVRELHRRTHAAILSYEYPDLFSERDAAMTAGEAARKVKEFAPKLESKDEDVLGYARTLVLVMQGWKDYGPLFEGFPEMIEVLRALGLMRQDQLIAVQSMTREFLKRSHQFTEAQLDEFEEARGKVKTKKRFTLAELAGRTLWGEDKVPEQKRLRALAVLEAKGWLERAGPDAWEVKGFPNSDEVERALQVRTTANQEPIDLLNQQVASSINERLARETFSNGPQSDLEPFKGVTISFELWVDGELYDEITPVEVREQQLLVIIPINLRKLTETNFPDLIAFIERKIGELAKEPSPPLMNIFAPETQNIVASLDDAMTGKDKVALAAPGGIDLKGENMGMSVTKDAQGGVQVTFDPAMIERIRREGIWSADPVIIQILPITPAQIRPLLGMEPIKEQPVQLAAV